MSKSGVRDQSSLFNDLNFINDKFVDELQKFCSLTPTSRPGQTFAELYKLEPEFRSRGGSDFLPTGFSRDIGKIRPGIWIERLLWHECARENIIAHRTNTHTCDSRANWQNFVGSGNWNSAGGNANNWIIMPVAFLNRFCTLSGVMVCVEGEVEHQLFEMRIWSNVKHYWN